MVPGEPRPDCGQQGPLDALLGEPAAAQLGDALAEPGEDLLPAEGGLEVGPEEEEEEKEEEKGKEKEMGKSNLAFLSLLEKSLTMHGTILAWNSTVSSSFPIWGEEKVREEEVEE